jgi:hypothetical protein
MSHKFHIPVLGLGYSIDTPLKVARYGISSVVSIVDDELIERMREYHSAENNMAFTAIAKTAPDAREKRITAYLNLLQQLVDNQFEHLRKEPFEPGSDICRYFDLLPEISPLKQGYDLMLEYEDAAIREVFQNRLRKELSAGAIDVNIMAKLDKMNFDTNSEFPEELNTDALAALRGFAMSRLNSSVILSAGMNPRLYGYMESFDGFFPDERGQLRKKITLKVSDFRSAIIQAKFLAKKGLWVSEFRIESGLNCGGHAFATDGFLLGPVLEEFKLKRAFLYAELHDIYSTALVNKGIARQNRPVQKISVQGGIGTADENSFLLSYYELDATGWGSPFLLVPEATNVDEDTLQLLEKAGSDDFYISNSSPLGILFNNFKGSSAEKQRFERIDKNKPGSPCIKKYLITNTEFTVEPICTASREYQYLKMEHLKCLDLPAAEYEQQVELVTEKVCLCEGLCSSVYLKYDISKPKENIAVTICPGPNLAYFSRSYTLDEMVKHIYGSLNLLQNVKRPHIFINELNLYIDYLKKELSMHVENINDKKQKYLVKFKAELENGIAYYKQLFPQIAKEAQSLAVVLNDLYIAEQQLHEMAI